ncbi:MAG: hypothetical protein CEE43_06035 [Promethearchaeota archaeon Loki_b32]|nr:MAG: hypothetical protein CEE43_06035 [Candidatus Lokiarchaeota archaeon Loki_b32]
MLKKERMEIIKELKHLKNRQNESNKEVKKLQNEFSYMKSNINKNDDEIMKNSLKLNELYNKKNELKKINTSLINEEIEKRRVEIEALYESQSDKLLNLGGFKKDKDRLNAVLKELKKAQEKQTLCWICGSNNIGRDHIEKELEDLNKLINPLQDKLDSIRKKIRISKEQILKNQELKKRKNLILDIQKHIKPIFEYTAKLQMDKDIQEEKIERIIAEIPAIEANIESRGKRIQQKELELKVVEDKIKKMLD